MNPESRPIKKLLYLDTLIKINAFFREAAAEFFFGVYLYGDAASTKERIGGMITLQPLNFICRIVVEPGRRLLFRNLSKTLRNFSDCELFGGASWK